MMEATVLACDSEAVKAGVRRVLLAEVLVKERTIPERASSTERPEKLATPLLKARKTRFCPPLRKHGSKGEKEQRVPLMENIVAETPMGSCRVESR